MQNNEQKTPKQGMNALIIVPIVMLVMLCLGAAFYFFFNHSSEASIEEEKLVAEQTAPLYTTTEAISMLDDTNISLSLIQNVEANHEHSGTKDEEDLLEARIIALKHIYTEVFLTESHSVKRLRNIYALHATEFSDDQRAILNNFFLLSEKDQLLWETMTGKVENFDDFAAAIDRLITQQPQ
jgi:hypothetical protein